MSKSTRIVIAAAAVGLAYPVAAWLLGGQVESALAAQYAQLAEQPYLKVTARSFDRGVFRSTERVTVEVDPALVREMLRGAAGQGEAASALRATLRSDIVHGPFPGWRTPALAVADTELELDADTRERLGALFGEPPPLALHTVYRFDGGGKSTLSSPAFEATVPADGGGEQRIEWAGLTLDMDFSRNMARYTLRGEAPKLRFADATVHIVANGMRVDAEQQRVFDDEPLLYAGTQRMRIDELRIDPVGTAFADGEARSPVLLQELVYDIVAPVSGDFVDIDAKLGAKVVRAGGEDFGPVHYDLSFKHLHARTLAAFSRAAMKLYSDAMLQQAGEGDADVLLATLAEPAMTLLSHDPQLSIERISFSSPHGEAMASVSVRPKGVRAEDMRNPFALIGKLEVSGRMSVPEALLATLDGEGGAALERQLASYAAQGLLRREAGVVHSDLVFKAGELRVNGRLVNPFALAEGAAPEGAGMSGVEAEGQPAR